MVKHFSELARYGRGIQVTSGNALAARLAKSVFDLGIPIHTDTPADELIVEDGRIVGVRSGARIIPGHQGRGDRHRRLCP